MQNLAALHCHNNSATAASPKICCDSYCEMFKRNQLLLWVGTAATYRNWINDRCKAFVRAALLQRLRWGVL